jgi:hypothetical protein
MEIQVLKKMPRFFAFVMLCTVAIAFSCNDDIVPPRKNNALAYDTSNIAIIKYESTFTFMEDNCTATELSQSDLAEIDSLLVSAVQGYNFAQEKYYKKALQQNPNNYIDRVDFLIDIEKYFRQYIPAINSKGEQIVLVSCCCKNLDVRMRSVPLHAKDGGHCFFSVKINLTPHQFFNLQINGDS